MSGYLDRGDPDVPPMNTDRWIGLVLVGLGAAAVIADGRRVDVPMLTYAPLIAAGAILLGPFHRPDGRFVARTSSKARIVAAVLVAAAIAAFFAFSQGA